MEMPEVSKASELLRPQVAALDLFRTQAGSGWCSHCCTIDQLDGCVHGDWAFSTYPEVIFKYEGT